MKRMIKSVFIAVFILSIAVLTLGSCDFDISGIFGKYVCVHEWSEWDIVEQGNCQNPGTIQRECTKCGAIDEETTALKDHIESEWITDQKASCVEEVSMHKECIVCGKTLSTKTISATGEHIESDWIVDKKATCIEEGAKHTECTICGATISTETILATGEHIESNWIVDKEATCIEKGSKHTECTVCGEILVDQEIISYLSHNYVDDKCEICGGTSEEYFEFTLLDDGTYSIKARNVRYMPSEIIIPSTYNGKLVSTIAYSAFYNDFDSCRFNSVVIPDSITTIGDYAFLWCYDLTSIVIPDSVTSIGDSAFYDCERLTRVVIGDNVKSIGSYAFCSCNGLTSIVIGSSVVYIGDNAFDDCDSLYVVHNKSDIFMEIGSIDNGSIATYAKVLVNKRITSYVYDSYEYILTDDDFLFRYKGSKYELMAYIGDEETITLPRYINNNTYDIYYMRGVSNVIIPDSITSIRSYAFYKCITLNSVVIPDSVITIGDYAFSNCVRLTSIVIPNSVTSIGKYASYYWQNMHYIYYVGTSEEWKQIDIDETNYNINSAARCYYSETKPATPGNFWHWVDGEVVVWE